jgi:acyl carrier protein
MNAAALMPLETKIISALLKRFPFLQATGVSADQNLTRDLGLDSMQLVQLLVDLEIEHGLDIPESALQKADFSTVAALATRLQSLNSTADLVNSQEAATTANAEQQPLDIKVHCFVSCLCEPIKKIPELDGMRNCSSMSIAG